MAGEIARIVREPNLDHVALEAELLVFEIRAAAKDGRLEQRDINQLHDMVRCCNLFLNPEAVDDPHPDADTPATPG